MKKYALLITLYACFVMIGGLIGFIKANSYASLIMSTSFTTALLICSYFIYKGHVLVLNIALGIQTALLLFFSYRFSLAYKFMPAGMMILLSAASIAYILWDRKQLRLPLS